MRIVRCGSIVAAAATLALVAAPRAQAADVGVDFHAGTLGAGLGLAFGLSDRWNGRVGFNRFTVEEDFTEDGIDYSTDLELATTYALADFHPFGGGFRISGGFMINDNELSGDADVDAGDQVGDVTVPPGQGGRLGASITFDSPAPYVGIGYGNHVDGWGPISFTVDLGILAQGSPSVDLDKEEGLQAIPDSEVDEEENQLEDDLSGFDVYPVLSVGLIYRF
jgi:hypothetical protein